MTLVEDARHTHHDQPTCIVRATAHAFATTRAKVDAELFTWNGK